MKNLRLITLLFFLFAFLFSCGSKKLLSYLGQDAPGMQPQVFASGVVSKADAHEFGSVFSKDGTSMYYGLDDNGRSEIWYVDFNEGVDSKHMAIFSHPVYSFFDPFLSPNGKRLYFISDRPLAGTGPKKDSDIWYATKKGKGWSEPINAGREINSAGNEYYVSLTKDGTIYYSSNKEATDNRGRDFDIYRALSVNKNFLEPFKLGAAINSGAYEADVFIAPDESYMIFCSVREGGFGQGDLYISFRDDEGNWSDAQNMGNRINTEGHELCPFVTADGEYFFYTRDKDIYWVDAEVIEAMRD